MPNAADCARAHREQERKRFFECADRLSRSRDPEEQKRLKEELARITFGREKL
jgi:hypothetical protein